MNKYPKARCRSLRWAFWAMLSFGVLSSAAAGESSGNIKVSATILKHASLTVTAQPGALVVTAADIARGYVDVPAQAHIAVHTNSPSYALDIGAQADFLRHIIVRGLGPDVQLSPAGGLVTQPASSTSVTRVALALGFRFVLADGARAGTYAWPVRMSALPI